MTHLFEVKTNFGRSGIYESIGQLMLHGALERNSPRRVLVPPGRPSGDTEVRLRRLGLEVLQYSWRGQTPRFLNLAK